MLAIGALALFPVSSCGSEQRSAPPAGPGSEPAVHRVGDAEVIMEPEREVQEVVSPAGGGRCAIDAAKICAAYGQLGPAAGDSRTVSIQIPGGPAIAVQCRYAGPGGALVSAAAPDTPPGNDSRAFLAAHGFCAAGPGR